MPRKFTDKLARRLDGLSNMDVEEAGDGSILRPGLVLVAPAGNDLIFEGGPSARGRVRVIDTVARHGASPVIDVTMKGAARVFGTFITWLQEKRAPVFVVATANEVDQMPPELLRKGRFDETFFVDLPDVHERRAILDIHLRLRGRDPADFDSDSLAGLAEHYSGAELEQGVVAGLYRAFDQGRELSTADIQHELEEIVPLYATYEEKIKALRDWAKNRARKASLDQSLVDLFDQE